MDKLESLIKMIKLNDHFYKQRCPLFEVEHLIKIGYYRDLIYQRLKDNNIEIVEHLVCEDIIKEENENS